ncbi:class I glutamine amidotransferase-like protein [Wallemia mellicola]|nr:class I glutamine amidotransferase-like protein [Wallemia mellicola]TIC34926.1 class I glutamine amidotransferase-like protein [Wallemia mellicola]TIC54679.1 class I glutamine amidotransferase-like protein [Wallemia mellicola]
MVNRTLKICFLKADTLPYEAIKHHGEYEEVLQQLIKPLCNSSDVDVDLQISKYDVVERQYPKNIGTYDAVIISGSFADSSIDDKMWVLRLCGFLIMLHDEYPHIRQIGICFGMQVLARAFGPSKIVANPKGWEVGSTELKLTEVGKDLLNPDVTDKKDVLRLQQIHQDCVAAMPSQFELLASSERTPIQGLAKYYDDDTPRGFTNAPDVIPEGKFGHIRLQGHPEWSGSIILSLIKEYEREGIFSTEYANEVSEIAKKPTDALHIGRALMKILGINTKKDGEKAI